MQKAHYAIWIAAPREKVWEVMLGDTTYREWTTVFNAGSYYRGSWETGSKILFLGPRQDGKGEGGMVSRIKESRLHEYVSIEHLGLFMDGVEDTTSEYARKWAPAYENYTFTDKDGGTELAIELDMEEENQAMFEETWPKALAKLKEIAERAS